MPMISSVISTPSPNILVPYNIFDKSTAVSLMMTSSLPEGRSLHCHICQLEMRRVRWHYSQTITGEQLVQGTHVATQWLEVDSNRRPSGYKAQNIPLHHHVPASI